MSEVDDAVSIGVEQAVVAAMQALPKYLAREPSGVRVEEVIPPSQPPYGGVWRITLSYLEDGVATPEHPALTILHGKLRAPPAPERVLKVIEVDARSGEARAMRLRDAH